MAAAGLPEEPAQPTELAAPTEPEQPTEPTAPTESTESSGTGRPGQFGSSGSISGMPSMGGAVQEEDTLYGLDTVTVASVTPQETLTVQITVDELDFSKIHMGQTIHYPYYDTLVISNAPDAGAGFPFG